MERRFSLGEPYSFFRRNLLALSRSDQSLGDRLLDAVRDPSLSIRAARSGAPVPVVRREGREAPLHSLVDPAREAERLERAQPADGFIVAFGLGAGYLLKRYLASSSTTGLLAVEYSAPMLRALLEEIDLSELFINERFSPPPRSESRRAQGGDTLGVRPAALGRHPGLPLRGRVAWRRRPSAARPTASKTVAAGQHIGRLQRQAFFGKLWFKNAVRNLFAAERHSAPLPPVRRAAVAAAGPWLEDQIPALKDAKASGAFLIATD